jgi:uncharacterized SAM-binding protein YcdF (DUF218 family)
MDVFFYLSKIGWYLVAPGNLLYLFALAGVVCYWTGHSRKAGILLSMMIVLMSVVAFFPVGDWLLYPLESQVAQRDMPPQIDGIIVLSGGVSARLTLMKGRSEVNEQVDRELAFIDLAKRHQNAKLLYTGGASGLGRQEYKGANAAAVFLAEHGFPSERLILEDESRNTFESAVLSKRRVSPADDETWVLITTAWHMPRALGVFCEMGWPIVPYPVDYRTQSDTLFKLAFDYSGHLQKLNVGVKEWLGLIAYSFAGKTGELLPSECG